MLLEVGSQGVEQRRVRGLIGLQQIKIVDGFDDAETHQFRPNPVREGLAELRMPGENAGERVAGVFTGLGAFAAEDESRRGVAAAAGDADDGIGLGIVFGADVVDGVLGISLIAVLPVHNLAGFAEKSRLTEELVALLGGEKQINFFEVVRAIVAGDAGEV